MNARLSLRFDARDGATRLRVDDQQPPWRVLRAFPQRDGGALAHLQNVSGGVLAGDRLRLEIDVAPNAIAQVTTTGATRLYRHREGAADSAQETVIRVGEGGLLEYLPDMLIPFAGARHGQSTAISLAEGATLFWWETLAPGRQAMNERFAFDCLRIHTEARWADRPLLLEDIVLEPRPRSLSSLARLGPYTHATSFYAMQPGTPAARWLELEAELNRFCVGKCAAGDIMWASSALAAGGVAVRGVSVSARQLPATLAHVWRIAKRYLTGRDAIPPRKVN